MDLSFHFLFSKSKSTADPPHFFDFFLLLFKKKYISYNLQVFLPVALQLDGDPKNDLKL